MFQNNPVLIRSCIFIVIAAGVMGALSVIAEGIGITSGKIFLISFLLILFGITATICMAVTRKPAFATLGFVGIFVSILGFVTSAIMVLAELADETLLKFVFTLFIASIALAHICLLHYFNLQNKYALYARIIATIMIALFSLSLILRVFEPLVGLYSLAYDQSTLKVLAGSFVLDLTATLLVPLCNRLPSEKPEPLTFQSEQPEPVPDEPGTITVE